MKKLLEKKELLTALFGGLTLILLLVLALDYLAAEFPQTYQLAEKFVSENGLLGLFFVILIGSTVLPSPTDAIYVIALKLSATNPLPSIFVAVLAAFIGSLLNYYLAFFFRQQFVRHFVKERELTEAKDLLDKYGAVPILLFGIIPASPVFDPLTFVAGLARMNFQKFAFYSLLSRILHFVVLAILALRIF